MWQLPSNPNLETDEHQRSQALENIKVNHNQKDKILTLTIDLSKKLGPSKSGKTVLIASTGRSEQVAPGIFLGLNLYTYEGAPGSNGQ